MRNPSALQLMTINNIYRLSETTMTEHSHHLCLLALASPVALDLAGVWAVSQNSIINV